MDNPRHRLNFLGFSSGNKDRMISHTSSQNNSFLCSTSMCGKILNPIVKADKQFQTIVGAKMFQGLNLQKAMHQGSPFHPGKKCLEVSLAKCKVSILAGLRYLDCFLTMPKVNYPALIDHRHGQCKPWKNGSALL